MSGQERHHSIDEGVYYIVEIKGLVALKFETGSVDIILFLSVQKLSMFVLNKYLSAIKLTSVSFVFISLIISTYLFNIN